jgi:hypothetical protein
MQPAAREACGITQNIAGWMDGCKKKEEVPKSLSTRKGDKNKGESRLCVQDKTLFMFDSLDGEWRSRSSNNVNVNVNVNNNMGPISYNKCKVQIVFSC